MTGNSLIPGTPDGVTGMIFAMEGIRGTVVLLNGPMGCRFYHSTTSQFLSIHPLLYMPGENGKKVPVDYNYLDNWFFRQQRVPCTCLDGDDYVFGTADKVKEGLSYLREHIDFSMLALVNAPGASLIGDQLLTLAKEALPEKMVTVLETPGFSEDFDHGYEQAFLQLLSQNREVLFSPGAEDSKRAPVVNVLGLSIWDRYFEGDREEIRRLLENCGIRVNCFLGADCTPEEIIAMPGADLNLVIDPARAGLICDWLQEHFGTRAYVCETLPIGFDAAEQMIKGVCRLLRTDPAAVIAESERARALAWYKINGIYQSGGLPQGACFAVAARLSQVYAYCAFLMDYLGMMPDVLMVTGRDHPAMRRRLEAFLETYHAADALGRTLGETRAELVLSDANHIGALLVTNRAFCGLEISLPGMGYTDLVKKTHLGIQGSLFLVEQVLNGLMTRL